MGYSRKHPPVGLLTYTRCVELIDEYKKCPNCGRTDSLIAVHYGSYPPGKYGAYWQASASDEIVCLHCCCVWNREEHFVELAHDEHWQETLRRLRAIE